MRAGGKWHKLVSYDDLEDFIKFITTNFPGKILIDGYDGLRQAIKEMSDTNHNTAEFGVLAGAFTVSYNDKDLT